MEDALATLHRYWEIVDAAEREEVSINEIYPYVGQQERNFLYGRYARGYAQPTIIGESIRDITSTTWVDDATVSITVCEDVSGVDVLSETGESLVADSRLDRQRITYVLEHQPSANELGWIVMNEDSRNVPCE